MKKLLLVFCSVILLTGCEPKTTKQKINSTSEDNSQSITFLGTVWIDTIEIHGKKHEIIVRNSSPGSRVSVGGMMHSPECWCQNENK